MAYAARTPAPSRTVDADSFMSGSFQGAMSVEECIVEGVGLPGDIIRFVIAVDDATSADPIG